LEANRDNDPAGLGRTQTGGSTRCHAGGTCVAPPHTTGTCTQRCPALANARVGRAGPRKKWLHAVDTLPARLSHSTSRHPQFWEIVVLVIGILESQRIAKGWNSLNSPANEQIRAEYNPGELGFDPLGLLPTDAAAKAELQTKEINNGRLAMIAIAGFAVHEEVDHITIWRGLVEDKIIPAEEANLLPY
jgi:hypothetical protein